MFDVTCPVIGQRVLIWPSSLIGIHNSDGVIDVAFTCACGAQAVVRTGAGVDGALVAHDHSAALSSV